MSKPAKSRRPPLDDPRWWSLDETLTYCRLHPLFELEDLAAAAEQGEVYSKLEYLDRSTRPAKRIVLHLTAEFFQREATTVPFWNVLALKNRIGERFTRPAVVSFWSPDIKKLWPDREPAGNDRISTNILPANDAATAAPAQGSGTPGKRGARRVHKWDKIRMETMRRIFNDGHPKWPESVNSLAGEIEQWCLDQFEKAPVPSELRRMVDEVVKGLRDLLS